MVNGLFELLEECDCVYTPVEEDETARAKVSQYEDTLGLLELEHIMERTKKLCLSGGGESNFWQRRKAGGGAESEGRLGKTAREAAEPGSGQAGSVQGADR